MNVFENIQFLGLKKKKKTLQNFMLLLKLNKLNLYICLYYECAYYVHMHVHVPVYLNSELIAKNQSQNSILVNNYTRLI